MCRHIQQMASSFNLTRLTGIYIKLYFNNRLFFQLRHNCFRYLLILSLIFHFILYLNNKQLTTQKYYSLIKIFVIMNHYSIHVSPAKKRIKTQINSLRSSQMLKDQLSYLSMHRRENNYKLPDLSRDEKNELTEINLDDGSTFRVTKPSRRNAISVPYHQKKQINRVEKIYDLLCNSTQPTEDIIISLKPENQSQAYEKVRQFYAQMKQSKKTKDVQQIFNFINYLKTINSLFTKIDDILSMILLKKGKIYEFEQNCYVYHQNEVISSMLIILWGEVKIKQIYRNKIKFCLPGDMLSQEVLVEQKKGGKKLFSDIGFVKGSFMTLQSAKSQTKCGLLQITKEMYEQIKMRFMQNGQKGKILILERMISSSLAKKSKLRR